MYRLGDARSASDAAQAVLVAPRMVVRVCYLARSSAGRARPTPLAQQGGFGCGHICLRHRSSKWEGAQRSRLAEAGCGSRRQTGDYDEAGTPWHITPRLMGAENPPMVFVRRRLMTARALHGLQWHRAAPSPSPVAGRPPVAMRCGAAVAVASGAPAAGQSVSEQGHGSWGVRNLRAASCPAAPRA